MTALRRARLVCALVMLGIAAQVVAVSPGNAVSEPGFWAVAGLDERSERSPAAPATNSKRMTWPSWTSAWRASVELRVYFRNDYIGKVVIQTYKRKATNDGSSTVDYWQVSRQAVGTPGRWESHGPDGNTRIAKLWISQNLTDSSHQRAREWMWRFTKPVVGFAGCEDNGTFTAGPFSFGIKDCEEYHPWTGRIGHHRMALDQGDVVNGGQREIAYVSGFTVNQGHVPAFTWYGFITLHRPHAGADMKCPIRRVGPRNGTAVWKCTLG